MKKDNVKKGTNNPLFFQLKRELREENRGRYLSIIFDKK